MRTLTILVLAVFLVACTSDAQKDRLTPEVIKLGVLPDQEQASLLVKYSPLVDYLSAQTGLKIELELSTDYAAMLDDFHAHRIHVANFGGLTFTEAERRDNAEPLVMRDTDLN
ncbi:MAG: PhnD/SsuA/transferrin family substrate-binding protein, partial [Gammaproteobacteria bacterium]|nr:PhnD/SsuA/transferrin family substrate-binding protein [Gammaproteobacteria bacterium]